MKEIMNIFIHFAHHNKDNYFTQTSLLLIRDIRLNCNAKMIMIELLSTDWSKFKMNLEVLQKKLKIGTSQFRIAWGQLKQYEYVIQRHIGNSLWKYEIWEIGDYRHIVQEPIEGEPKNMKEKCERNRRENEYWNYVKEHKKSSKTSADLLQTG